MAYSDQSPSKRQQLGSNPDQNGIDRLSNLPEHLLLHILSFLPTETAATTCSLSKTWQFLWTLVPTLDFDDYRTTKYISIHESEEFQKFVNQVLLRRREPFIRRFRLKCNSYCPSDSVESWVCFAITHNVQELDLDLGDEFFDKSFRFLCRQQSCKTLVALKLRSAVLDRRLDEVSFPILKILHLEMPYHERHEEIKFLPSGFPVLEELVFKKSTHNISNIEICLPKLRSLAITLSFNDGHHGLARIDCPALTHLVVSDRHSREYHLENPLCLVEANIDYGRQPIIHRAEPEFDCARSLMNVLKAIRNVRILRLSHHTMKEIELYLKASHYFFCLDHIPVFHNLVQVEFPFVGSSWEIIILVLQKFENLERLTLCYQGNNWEGRGGGIGRPRVDRKELIKQTQVPNCLTSHLTTLCFRKFKGSNDELEVTRYILKNSLVLENMTIFSSYLLCSMDGPRIRRELCKSPTASEGCRFEFVQTKDVAS